MDLVMAEHELEVLLIDVDLCSNWATLLDRSPATITAFFLSVPNAEAVTFVSTYLNRLHIDAVQKVLPNAVIEVNAYYVQQMLDGCMERMRREEAGNLLGKASSNPASLILPSDAPGRIALEYCAHAKNEVDVMHRSGHLFEGQCNRLNSTRRRAEEFLLCRVPAYKEVYELSQKVRQLYRTETYPAAAAAFLNQWLDELSDEARRFVRPFAHTGRHGTTSASRTEARAGLTHAPDPMQVELVIGRYVHRARGCSCRVTRLPLRNSGG